MVKLTGRLAHCRHGGSGHSLVVRELVHLIMSANKPLVPTRNGEAPLLAAQRRR
jgi:hypothetical protein